MRHVKLNDIHATCHEMQGGLLMIMGQMTRRSFVTAAAATAGASIAGVTATRAVSAAESEEADQDDGSTFSWPGKEPDIVSDDIAETIETEVLVCGAGHAGMIAAVSASTEGAKTLVIEKNGMVGTTRSYIGAIGSRAQKELGVVIDKQQTVNDLVRYASGRCDQALINMWANESGAALDWLEEQVKPYGIEMHAEPDVGEGMEGAYACGLTHHRPILSTTLSYEPVFTESGACNTVTYWLGKLDQSELNNDLVEIAQKNGAEFRFDTPLVRLVHEDGKVTGAIARNKDGSYVRINASRGVILCCGGYAADPVVYRNLNPGDYRTTTFALVQSGCDGSGIRAGIWAGGRKDDVPTAMLFDRGGVAPGDARL